MNVSDHELLKRFLSTGDQPPFAELVRRHLGLVHAAAVRITNRPALAEEVSQVVFAKLAGLSSPLKPELSLVVWLHRTTRSAAIDVVRVETRRQRREEIAAAQLAMNEPSIPWERIAPVLDDVLDKLPPEERHAVLSCYFEGQSLAEVAGPLGLTEDALRMRVKRSLEKIRVLLQRRGITTTASALALVLPAHALATPVPAGLAASLAAKAAASFTPSLTLTQIIIMTMTKKSALMLTAAGCLLVAGVGIAVFNATKSKDPAAAMAGASSSAAGSSLTDDSSGDGSRFKAKGRSSKDRAEADAELVAKYGEARVRLASRVASNLLHLVGEDGIMSIMKASSGERKDANLAELKTKINLTEAQQKAAADLYDKTQARMDAAYLASLAYLNSNPRGMTETLLAGDAMKRGKISEAEYKQISENPDSEAHRFNTNKGAGAISDVSILVGDPEFADELKSSLDPAQAQALADLIAAGPQVTVEEPDSKGGQTAVSMSLSYDSPQTLEDLDQSVSSMTPMIESAVKYMQQAKANAPAGGPGGGK
jgi:RNA polymerase sigma factor (sigma-70 family)